MSEEVDIIEECANAGIVFRPLGGKLRPQLTHGPISATLKTKIERNKEKLLMFFVAAFEWSDFDSEIIAVKSTPRHGSFSK